MNARMCEQTFGHTNMHADRQTDIGIDGRTQTYALMHAGMQSRMHILIMIIIIIKSLFSEDYILSTGTYLKYGPLNIKIT